MFRVLRFNIAKIAIFAVSFILGGIVYLGVSLFGAIKAPTGQQQQQTNLEVGSVELNDTKFNGEFKLFAVTDNPVDLGYDKTGAIYFLGQSGEIVKSTFDEDNKRQLSRYFEIETGKFLRKNGCSAIAFHPDFTSKHTRGYGKFFVAMAEQKDAGFAFEPIKGETHQEVIYEFTATDHLKGDFAGNSREVFRISGLPDVEGNMITDLTFDHRGLLYIGVCDSTNSENSRASDLQSVYGKVLRIDPLKDDARDQPYRVPGSNPFYLVESSLSELWSYGLRNPHTITYDPFREWVCISDTGQDMLEEINVSHFGAEFFGWNLSEGSFFYPPAGRNVVGDEIASPQIEYARGSDVGRNVGGMIYRGERFPYLDGKAIFADESGRLLTAEVAPEKHTRRLNVLKPFGEIKGAVKSMKSGPNGELFVLCENGKIFELSKTRPMLRHQRNHRAMLAVTGLY